MADLIDRAAEKHKTVYYTSDRVDVVHGRWVKHEDDVMPWVSCSECGRDIAGWFGSYAYCPYCGAKMDGERREDDDGNRNNP